MSRRRKTNHLKRGRKSGWTSPANDGDSSIVLTLVGPGGELVDVDVTDDPAWAELAGDLAADCPDCRCGEGGQ